jgi:hypothetical protein
MKKASGNFVLFVCPSLTTPSPTDFLFLCPSPPTLLHTKVTLTDIPPTSVANPGYLSRILIFIHPGYNNSNKRRKGNKIVLSCQKYQIVVGILFLIR